MPFPAFLLLPKLLGLGSSLFGFALKYWKQLLVLGMVATIFHQNFMETEVLKWVGVRTIPGMQYELVVAKEQLKACEDSRVELKGAIDSANADVERWASTSKKLQKQHDNLVHKLTTLKQESQAAVQDILTGPTPQTCTAAIDYLKAAAQEDLKWAPSLDD